MNLLSQLEMLKVVKPKGIKRQKDTWCIYPERSIVDIIMATEVSFNNISVQFT